jgi:hypothetical protein
MTRAQRVSILLCLLALTALAFAGYENAKTRHLLDEMKKIEERLPCQGTRI